MIRPEIYRPANLLVATQQIEDALIRGRWADEILISTRASRERASSHFIPAALSILATSLRLADEAANVSGRARDSA